MSRQNARPPIHELEADLRDWDDPCWVENAYAGSDQTVDELIFDWHTAEPDGYQLHETLGMTWRRFRAWVEGRFHYPNGENRCPPPSSSAS